MRYYYSKFISCGIILFLMSAISFAQLSGDYYIPQGSNPQGFATLAAAFTAVNTSGLSGTVTFYIDDNLAETAANCVINRADLSSANNLVIKPAPGKTPTITFTGCATTAGASQYSGMALNATDYVTIDGSNTSGGTTKDLTLAMADATNGRLIITLFGDCDNIVMKNCNYIWTGTMNSANNSAGIYINGQASGSCDNVLMQNNTIGDATNFPYYGLRITGNSSVYASGIVAKGNILMASMRAVYYYLVGLSGTISTISGNQITCPSTSITGYVVYGIILNTYKGTINVYDNKIVTLKTNNATNQGLNGISTLNAATSSDPAVTVNIYNNFFGDFQCLNPASNTTPVNGVYIQDGPTYNIYNNTISISPVNNTTNMVCGINCASGGTPTVKNNIIINGYSAATDNSIGLRILSGSTITSDYNDIVVQPTSSTGAVSSTKYVALADWQTATSQDAHSKAVAVQFMSATDLHLDGPSIGDENLIGTPLAMVTTDIDGEDRDPDFPYMGADENADALPVELTSFTASAMENKVQLKWNTATEVCNYGFEIERSFEKGEWENIGFVKGNGNSSAPMEYSFLDYNVKGQKEYSYRLKQLDNDGSYSYSSTATVFIDVVKDFTLSQNFPNPFNPSTVIRFSLPQAANVKLIVFNSVGEEVNTLVSETLEAGTHNIQFNANGLASGVYFYRLQAGSYVKTMKMQLVK